MKTTTATKASTINTKFGTFGLWDHNCAIWGLKEKGVTNLFCVYIYEEEGRWDAADNVRPPAGGNYLPLGNPMSDITGNRMLQVQDN